MRFLVSVVIAAACAALAAADDVFATLVISTGVAAPDCRNNTVLLVNGTFTGPTLSFRKDDSVTLTIVNTLDMPFSMHLHGVNQVGTPFSDGASGITSVPMAPHSVQAHTSILTDAGTFFYHAHLKLLDLHVYGPLIVHDDDDDAYAEYDERVVMLSDYWRADLDTLHAGLVDTPAFQFVGAPQAFLTNGKTVAGNCTAAAASFASLDVVAGETYRVRLIGATSLFVVHFRIPNHTLTVIEIEGTWVEPIDVDVVEVLPGQRLSVLLTADQPVDNYWMQTTGKWRAGAPTNGFAILHYDDAVDATTLRTPPALLPAINETVGWQDQFRPANYNDDDASTLPGPATDDDDNDMPPLVLNGTQVTYGPNGTQRRWAMNGTVYEHYHATALIDDVIAGTVATRPAGARPFAYFEVGQVVDIVLQNNVAVNGVCEVHPWHLHGHSFWVVNAGAGDYTPASHATDRTAGAVKRDVVAVYPTAHAYNQPVGVAGAGCGWAKIRFVADNVGAWALHCHIASHFAMGMAVSFVTGEDVLGDPDEVEALRCASGVA
ncbi:Aste57867_9108 [Aphanomyces stellatus]|uniref:Aste57867_9108 protein n=1 Tax=Aphanomyces stellatus TaxID=120398 RepID=A0A485KM61_9STRA|nr:hypothetical protein As57867_009072 [Aphanomyces stellatus]VFT85992.1 Aste57867_9108 [Aphanomyces stellatus]